MKVKTGQRVVIATPATCSFRLEGYTEAFAMATVIAHDGKNLCVIPDFRKLPSALFPNRPVTVKPIDIVRVLDVIEFGAATYTELQIAAKYAGSPATASLPTADGGARLVEYLRDAGYNRIQVNPNNRLTHDDLYPPYGIAVPLKVSVAKSTAAVKETIVTKKNVKMVQASMGRKFLKQFGIHDPKLLKAIPDQLLKYDIPMEEIGFDTLIKTLRRSLGKPGRWTPVQGISAYRWAVPNTEGALELWYSETSYFGSTLAKSLVARIIN